MRSPTSSTELRTILVIGASGLIGRAVAASLVSEPSLSLIATIRNPQSAGAKQLALPPDNIIELEAIDQPALEHLFEIRKPAVAARLPERSRLWQTKCQRYKHS